MEIAARVAQGGAEAEARFAEAVLTEAWAQDRAFLAGIAAYRRHPYTRAMEEPAAIWAEGGSRLLDYAPGSGAPVVLLVPSLINRAYILDLKPQKSLLRFLAGAGLRPLLLDWGEPGALEARFTLTDYIAGRLERAMGAVAVPMILAGYCMGGLLTLAAALRRPEMVRGLALLATPWDFHAPEPARAQALAAILPALEPAMAITGLLATDLMQMLFTCLAPYETPVKYRHFGKLDQAGASAELFVALEDWLNDGVPLAAPVARACLGEWYGENTPGRGEWTVAGAPVQPARLACPSFVAIPSRDRIVPPESALALAERLPGAHIHRPAAGHIGMAAGRRAEAELWRPLRDWCHGL
ncbi:MAG TPA: alpha/beta fold hydrolase [Acidisoma sp.]|uniref:alpha/beta fold hydrolase n=1 Tax=Acidisoma sp. TaxID=1872115 RepID=UPI002C846641|nr:alpha/beta fold hydrolase [Acidisoma sp.]HTH99978.1 alpha/beta fold hydrolase [Acidisoma sp.]